MYKAKEIMNTKVVCVRPEMPIYEAIRLMTRSNLSNLPVVDANLKLLGILSENDVLQLLYDTKDNPDLRVSDFMKKDVITFKSNEPLIAMCDCLLENPLRRIPIVHQEMLIGIVTRTDIIECILKIKNQHNKNKMAS